MSIVGSLSKLGLISSKFSRPLVPYIKITGLITSKTTNQVNQLLSQVPKSAKKIAVVINSHGGQMSQALIISQKLKKKAKDCNAELITFAGQCALNSGFFLFTQGNKAYADTTSFLGGLQVGVSKINNGLFSQYIKHIVYTQDSSYVAQLRNQQPITQEKKAQLKQLFEQFSKDMRTMILLGRKNLKTDVDISKFYSGEQAVKLGISDGVGRINQTIPKLIQNPRISLIAENETKKLLNSLRGLTNRF